MNLLSLRDRIERFFDEIDRKTASFREEMGLVCPRGCGVCCEYPRIEATVLEMIPLACHLWETDRAMEVYRAISPEQTICHFFRNGVDSDAIGLCSAYLHRGLICRTFGFFAARRSEGIRFSTCKALRQRGGEITSMLSPDELCERLPVYPDFLEEFRSIAPELASETYHVNHAIKRAIEVVFSLQDEEPPKYSERSA